MKIGSYCLVDKDFIQLHNDRVKQYNPVLNKFVGQGETQVYILENIY